MKSQSSKKSDREAAPTAKRDEGGESSAVSVLSVESGMFPVEDSPPVTNPNDVRTRSGLEQEVLEDLLMNDAHFSYESMKITWTREPSVYTPDFVVTTRSRKKIVIEAKGWFRVEDRVKMSRVVLCNPHLDVRMIFENANQKISKGSKTTVGQWCDKRNIKWAEHKVPRKWLEE